MFSDFIPNDLILFWIFFIFLSVLPMILALITEKTSAKNRTIMINNKEEK